MKIVIPKFLKKKTAALAFPVAAVFAVLAWNWEYLSFVYRVEVQPDGHVASFAPVADYLSPPLEKGDYAALSARSSVVGERLARSWFSWRLDSAFESLDGEKLALACSDVSVIRGTTPLSEYCESAKFTVSQSLSPSNCDDLVFARNRKDCKDSNDVKFSEISDSHCSKSDCVVDNALYRDSVLKTAVCSEVPDAVRPECERVGKEFEKYRKSPESFFDADLESALSWKTSDPVLLAARSAVLDNPDSPSVSCDPFPAGRRPYCESRVKGLFSYVQTRALRERFERIVKALDGRTSGTTEKPSR